MRDNKNEQDRVLYQKDEDKDKTKDIENKKQSDDGDPEEGSVQRWV